jgi:hypothetical protein
MTTLNFPSDPSLNQTYEAATKKWIWNGTYWKAISPTERIGYTGSAGVDGTLGLDGYTGSQGSIGYTGSQGYGSVSFLTRNYTGNNTSTVFTISAGLGVDNVFVFENGVMQFPTTDYTVTGTNLTFTTAPATGVIIQIRELNSAGSIDPTSLSGLTDVDVASAVAGQVLGYTGSNWVAAAGGGNTAAAVGYSLIFGG